VPPELIFELTDKPEPSSRQVLVDGLVAFNESQTGLPDDFHRLALLLRTPETGTVIGGLWGATHYAHLFVELLFVPETPRRTGTGRRLMQEAEAEALRRGCSTVWLDTYSFQARGFYERLGYSVFGAMDGFPPGHSRYSLRKALPDSSAT
jgi:GNAT superfamily N-acetyltransferase